MVRRERKSPPRGGDRAAGTQATPPDVDSDSATPVSDDCGPGAAVFTGRVRLVRIDLAAEDLDHLSTPEERLYLAMARAVVSLPPRLDRKHEWRSTSE